MGVLQGIDASAMKDESWMRPFDMNRRPDYQTRYAFYPAIAKPVIAMLNGPTAGIGLVHALYCDIRFAADTAVFTTSFARRGLIAEHGLSWMLPRIVGHANALDLLLSARKVLAPEAQAMGLVNKVHRAEELAAATYAYARDLADNVSPRSMAVIKRQQYEAPFQTLAENTISANAEMLKSFGTEDFREGVAHFVEKRAPRFTGR
jgi:enoyl-CoA hydratase/carnithine racemase